jgi:hypothetical protein
MNDEALEAALYASRRSKRGGTVKANKYRPFSASNPAERLGDS